jgi:hypothetical protein
LLKNDLNLNIILYFQPAASVTGAASAAAAAEPWQVAADALSGDSLYGL